MKNCEETREHLESCEDCRLHVSVEARLRTLPVLEPPRGLAERVMKALPRPASLRREFLRIAAAAAILVGLAVAALASRIDRHEKVRAARDRTVAAFQSAVDSFNEWRSPR
jgi:hypothetical protein